MRFVDAIFWGKKGAMRFVDAIFGKKKGAMRFRLRCDAIAIPELHFSTQIQFLQCKVHK